jgi:hypothetical protein
VATNSGGVAEILGDAPERLGALVPVDDPVALSAAIVDVLARRASFEPSSLRAAVVERFGGRAVATRLVGLYGEVASEATLRSGAATPETARRGPRAPDVGVLSTAASHGPGTPRARRTVVLGLDREGLGRRLAALPVGQRAGLTVVTTRQPQAPLPAIGRVVEIDAPRPTPTTTGGPGSTSPAARFGRVLRHPIATVRRRIVRSAGPEAEATRTEEAVASSLDTLAAEAHADGATLELVFMDGRDVLAVWRHPPAADVQILAGSIRRLADRAVGADVDAAASPDVTGTPTGPSGPRGPS